MNLPLWVEIALIGLLTFLVRLSFIAVLGRLTLGSMVEQTLGLVPIAVLVAIIVPAVVSSPASGVAVPRLVAAVVAAVVAWRTRRAVLTIAIGMAIVLIGERLMS